MLDVQDLSKSFQNRRVVDALTLRVRAGEVYAMLGPNGAGKSTTVGMITGLVRADAGTVRINDADPTRPDTRRHFGLVPQSIGLYEDLAGLENMRFFARVYGLPRSSRDARIGELLEAVGLTDRARDRVEVYSGGMKRRLNLAAALLHEPGLILLDEPTAGVDPQSRHHVHELIRQRASAGAAVLLTTHDMTEAERLADRVGVLDHGRLLAEDTVQNLINAHGGGHRVSIEREGGTEQLSTDDPAHTVRVAFDAGAVNSIAVDRPDLEHVFFTLTGRSLRD